MRSSRRPRTGGTADCRRHRSPHGAARGQRSTAPSPGLGGGCPWWRCRRGALQRPAGPSDRMRASLLPSRSVAFRRAGQGAAGPGRRAGPGSDCPGSDVGRPHRDQALGALVPGDGAVERRWTVRRGRPVGCPPRTGTVSICVAPRRTAPGVVGGRLHRHQALRGGWGRMSLVAVQSRRAGGVAVGYLATDSLETRRGWPVRSDAHRALWLPPRPIPTFRSRMSSASAGRVDLRWTPAKASAPRGRLRRSGLRVGSPTDRPPGDLAVLEGVQAARRAYRTERAAFAARSQDPVSSSVLPRRC